MPLLFDCWSRLGWRSLALVIVFCALTSESFAACALCSGSGCAFCRREKAKEAAASDEPTPISLFSTHSKWFQPQGIGSQLTLTYSYNNFLDGGLKDPNGVSVPANYIRTVVEEAFGLWAAVAPLNFVEVEDVGTAVYRNNSTGHWEVNRIQTGSPTPRNDAPSYTATYSPFDFGQIRLSHYYHDGSDADNGGTPSPKAFGYFPGFGGYIAGDIQFDNGDPWAVMGTSDMPDILGIVTHEIGHALGLAHTTVAGSVMFPAALRMNGPGTGTLTQDDIDGIRSLYGAGVGSVTPLIVVPEPGAAALACWALLGVACGSAQRRPKR